MQNSIILNIFAEISNSNTKILFRNTKLFNHHTKIYAYNLKIQIFIITFTISGIKRPSV